MMRTETIPFIGHRIPAGFPSPAQDWHENRIDLTEMLIPSPDSTFLFRVSGESMKNAGILDNSLLLVDRAETVVNRSIVVASVRGEFTVKRFEKRRNIPVLVPENPDFPIIKFTEDTEIWGVVTAVITRCMRS